MVYQIQFEGEIRAAELRRFLADNYGIAPAAIYVGRIADRSADDPRPVAMFTPPEDDEEFGWVLIGDTELADATGLGERELAVALARAFRIRALVDDGSFYPDRWLLVSTDGSTGRVRTDEDAAADGNLRILYALEPIRGEPQLAVVPPRDWSRDGD
ncbi:hypothetical protein AB0B85_00100 [Micromonospora sp. NPDC049044]|uniref:hypothetical protein n=1 Tax=Micromonospora sp. NPDC049044 TaxID=3154827 RepID=UPI0033CF6435